MGSRGRRRERIIEIVSHRDIPALEEFACRDGANLLMMLDMLTYRYPYDDLMRWRAIEATGLASSIIARDNLEIPREFVRKQFWLMSDESGATAWYAAELAGEVLYRVEALRENQSRPLVYFLDESPFKRGAHYGVARISRVSPGCFSEDIPRLSKSLNDADPYIRYYSILALLSMDVITLDTVNDDAVVDIYDYGRGAIKSGTITDLLSDMYNTNGSEESDSLASDTL